MQSIVHAESLEPVGVEPIISEVNPRLKLECRLNIARAKRAEIQVLIPKVSDRSLPTTILAAYLKIVGLYSQPSRCLPHPVLFKWAHHDAVENLGAEGYSLLLVANSASRPERTIPPGADLMAVGAQRKPSPMPSSIALVTCFRATATVPMARASHMLTSAEPEKSQERAR